MTILEKIKLARLSKVGLVSNTLLLVGLICLGSAAYFLSQDLELDANDVAIYAFFFLTAGVVGKIIQHAINSKKNNKG
jgi:multisubunit Na+/H+ antiporter MnhG subunit